MGKRLTKTLLFVHYLTAGAWAGGELWRVHLKTGAKQVATVATCKQVREQVGSSTQISGKTVEPQA